MHFTVLVIGEDPEAQLAPFNEETARGDNGKWDWYELGGRWTGFFKLKDGAKGVVGTPGLQTHPASQGCVDQARKKDIDFSASRLPTFAVIKDGKWHDNDDESPNWGPDLKAMVEDLPPDTLLSVFDCHS